MDHYQQNRTHQFQQPYPSDQNQFPAQYHPQHDTYQQQQQFSQYQNPWPPQFHPQSQYHQYQPQPPLPQQPQSDHPAKPPQLQTTIVSSPSVVTSERTPASPVTSTPESIDDVDPEADTEDPDDSDDLSAIRLYLSSSEYRSETTKNEKNSIRKRAKRFELHNDKLFYKQTTVESSQPTLRQVITNLQQRRRIIQQCHAVNGVDGHFGIKKTISAVTARFYWKGISDDVTQYVKTCDPCQRENPQLHKAPATLHPIPITAGFWHQVGVDLVGPLQTTTQGSKYILTCCCYFTKWTEAIPIKDKTALTVAKVLFTLQCQKGSASVFIHDQGTEFVNQVNNELCNLMHISKRIATAYHPMTNGMDERWNQTLQTALRKVIDPHTQNDWDQHLEPIMSAYRATRHESTGMTPYFMVHHQEPRLPVDIDNRDDIPTLDDKTAPILHDKDTFERYAAVMLDVKKKIFEKAEESIKKAQNRQKKNFDKRHLIPSYAIGTMVLLKNMAREARQGGKMDSHFTGPYEIVEEVGKGVYRLKNPKTSKVLAKSYNSMRFKIYFAATEHTEVDKKRKAECIDDDLAPPPPTENEYVWIKDLNLKTADKDSILNNDELNDRCMDAASTLLSKQFPSVRGLQSTLLTGSKEHCIHMGIEEDSFQLLHQSSRHHWMATAVIDGQLYMYDSIPLPIGLKLPQEIRTSLSNLYGDHLTSYLAPDNTQQKGSVDCGLFAIAFLTALCHGQRPEKLRIQQAELRPHLLKCLKSQELTPFPATQKRKFKPPIRREFL